MRRTIAVLAALGLMLVIAAPQALAAKEPKDNDTHVQLLAFNDFHGHLEPNTPGTIQTGCCIPNSTNTAWTPMTVPAGGVEYFSTYIKSPREMNSNTITVGAGDLIGASPLISGLFHDEPTIHAMNAIGVDVSGVGNHEFDEGIQELLRMQNGGCAGVDTCQLDAAPWGIVPVPRRERLLRGHRHTILPPYEIKKIDNAKIAFIGLTLEATPTIVTPAGVAGLEFRPEVPTVNALVQKLRNENGVRAFVVLLHQGGFQTPPAPGPFPATPNPNGYTDVDRCVGFAGPEVTAIAQGLDPQVDVIVSAHTHAPYICQTSQAPASSSRGLVLRSRDHGHRSRDRPSDEGREVGHGRQRDRQAGRPQVPEGSCPHRDRRSLPHGVRTDREPDRRLGHGRHHACVGLERRVGARRRDRGRPAEGDGGHGLRQFEDRVHEPGRNPLGSDLRQFAGGEAAGQVTYGELFTVQPFGNSLVVKTCTGAQLKALLEQQIFPTTRILQVSNGFTYSFNAAAPAGSRVDASSIKLNGVTLDPAVGYRVTMNSFLASGGDGFTVFNQCTDALGGEIDLDALVRYFQQFGDGNPPPEPVPPGPQNRITRIGCSSHLDGLAVPGYDDPRDGGCRGLRASESSG